MHTTLKVNALVRESFSYVYTFVLNLNFWLAVIYVKSNCKIPDKYPDK